MHLDEVQQLLTNARLSEGEAGELLGGLVKELAEAVWDQRQVGIFPIFYVSGLSKTLVYRTKSSDPPIIVNLPLFTAPHYIEIIRALFGLAADWQPPDALMRALRCIEGPPRLLLVFLFAMQSSGKVEGKIFGTMIDCELLAAKLRSFTWPMNKPVLNRCLDALEVGRLVTFTDSVKQGSDRLELFHSLAALVLLGRPIALAAKLEPHVTVNEAIQLGFVFSQPVPGEKEKCCLFWL